MPQPRMDWRVLDAAELVEHPQLLEGLLDRSIDGVTISNVLAPDEIARAVHALEELDEKEKMAIPFGWIIGMPLGSITDTDRTPYLDDTERARQLYTDAFGFEPHERVAEVLAPISGGAKLIGTPEAGRFYNAGQVRSYSPGMGGLPAHVGNEFRGQLEHTAMSHMVATTHVTDHLSYFVMLRPPESGGELTLYDLLWEDNQGHSDYGDISITGFPDDSWIETVPNVKLSVRAGEMVLFGGGWRWHRVEPPGGVVDRLTYGGFAAPSLCGSAVHFWS